MIHVLVSFGCVSVNVLFLRLFRFVTIRLVVITIIIIEPQCISAEFARVTQDKHDKEIMVSHKREIITAINKFLYCSCYGCHSIEYIYERKV